MRNKFKAIFDAWVTTVIGLATMVVTLILVWQKVFDFVWEGIGGLVAGVILIMAPKSVENFISKGIEAWGSKSNSIVEPPAPPPDDQKIS